MRRQFADACTYGPGTTDTVILIEVPVVECVEGVSPGSVGVGRGREKVGRLPSATVLVSTGPGPPIGREVAIVKKLVVEDVEQGQEMLEVVRE